MSYTRPMLIQRRWWRFGRPEILGLEDLRNSHGFGPFVWGSVAERFLPGCSRFHVDYDKLWPLWKDPRLPAHWSAALLTTYDYAIVEQGRMHEIAAHLRAFSAEAGGAEYVNHMPRIADLLDAHADEPRVIGMCFYGTSVCEDWWHPWDEERDRGDTYDVRKKGRHFCVGASLDSLRSPEREP